MLSAEVDWFETRPEAFFVVFFLLEGLQAYRHAAQRRFLWAARRNHLDISPQHCIASGRRCILPCIYTSFQPTTLHVKISFPLCNLFIAMDRRNEFFFFLFFFSFFPQSVTRCLALSLSLIFSKAKSVPSCWEKIDMHWYLGT